MAPEILLNRNNHQLVPYKGEKIDIFSLGVTIFTLVFKTMPFISANPYRDKYYKYID
jgi:serine/threonine protein kinase